MNPLKRILCSRWTSVLVTGLGYGSCMPGHTSQAGARLPPERCPLLLWRSGGGVYVSPRRIHGFVNGGPAA